MAPCGEYLSVRNFDKYQHYTKRKPPWIKMYYRLLSDPDFVELSDASKLHTFAIMLLASQHDNKVPFNKAWIARAIFANSRINWNEVLSSGFIICYQDASKSLASRKQHAIAETETETETEIQRQKRATSAPAFLNIICIGNEKTYRITAEYIEKMKALYPGINVESETKAAAAWLISNPTKRKTARGVPAYLNRWYKKAQDNGAKTTSSAGMNIGEPQKDYTQADVNRTRAKYNQLLAAKGKE